MTPEDKLEDALDKLAAIKGLTPLDEMWIEQTKKLIREAAAELGYKWAVN